MGSFIIHLFHHFMFMHYSTVDYMLAHKMFCSCEVSSLVLSVCCASKGCFTIYVIIYIRGEGYGEGGEVGGLLVAGCFVPGEEC